MVSAEERLAGEIIEALKASGIQLNTSVNGKLRDGSKLKEFQALVTNGNWTEFWPDDEGTEKTITVEGEIWTSAIQTALDSYKIVFIPAREEPYYIDRPLILRSGYQLIVDPKAEIRLKPDTNTCMVRNENVVSGQNGPVTVHEPDTDILVEGGLWTTLRTMGRQSNGNYRGRADFNDSILGAHGVLLFNNVRKLQVRNVTIRKSVPFGLQLALVSHFLIEGIKFEDHGRDGIHAEGECRDGAIREIHGVTHDDFLALNAWDWQQYSMIFGSIERIIIENIDGFNAGAASLRLLAGTKNFPNGEKLDCDIADCVFRNIRGIREFKLYDQPNLELGRDKDFADPIGKMNRLFFRDMEISVPVRPATLQIHSNIDSISIEDVILGFQLTPIYKLVSIGPNSFTFKFRADDPKTWVELFSPDKDCTVKNLNISGIRTRISSNHGVAERKLDPESLVTVIQQTINPDYPESTPKGGTGKGIWVR